MCITQKQRQHHRAQILNKSFQMIQLQQQSDWPVPYIHYVSISDISIEGRCGTCRQFKVIYFFYVGRNVAKGPAHGGWYDGNHGMECDDCIDEYLSTRAEVRSVIKDGRQ
jgi:hypothetical protein